MQNRFLWLLILLLPLSAQAARKRVPKVLPTRVTIKVIHHEVTTDIDLQPSPTATLATLKNNRGRDLKQNLEKTDFAYAVKQFDLRENEGNKKCPKAYILVTHMNAAGKPAGQAIVCYGKKNGNSKKWTESVQTLSQVIAFHPPAK
jgi:hypothetical protein